MIRNDPTTRYPEPDDDEEWPLARPRFDLETHNRKERGSKTAASCNVVRILGLLVVEVGGLG